MADEMTPQQWRAAAVAVMEHAMKWLDIATERESAWTVPLSHRPTCPLDQQPCTSWTCLVDVCVDERKAG